MKFSYLLPANKTEFHKPLYMIQKLSCQPIYTIQKVELIWDTGSFVFLTSR